MSDVLFYISLVFLLLALGVSRSISDGKKSGPKGTSKGKSKRNPKQDTKQKAKRDQGPERGAPTDEEKKSLRLAWILGIVGGILWIVSRILD